MKNGIILYQSKYGATKKYAEWLAEETGFDMQGTKEADFNQIKDCHQIILAGAIYASGISGLSFLKKHPEISEKTKVFCVGASPYDPKAFKEITKHNLKDFPNVPCFYGRGAWKESEMTFRDRTLCKMLKKAVAKKDPENLAPWEKALMEAMGKECDWTDRKYLEPLVTAIKAEGDGQ